MTIDSLSEQDPRCLIIGAGIAGLFAARELHRQGIRVRIVEKARGVGGRMATRRFDGGVFDHGTQYFAPGSAWFQTRIDEWMTSGIAREWFRVSQYELDPRFLSAARYCGADGMTTIPKHIAEGLDIDTGMKISGISENETSWKAIAEDGAEFSGQACILTAPLPQAIELLDQSSLVEGEALQALRSISYDPCICVLANCTEAPRLPANGVLEFTDGPIRRIMDNRRKGISPIGHAITIHGSAAFSKAHFDLNPEESGALLLSHALPFLGVEVQNHQVHRWKYSTVPRPSEQPFHVVREAPPLLLAGDAFGNNGVEGAARSGLKAAMYIRDCFARRGRG